MSAFDDLPSSWKISKLEEISDDVTYGYTAKSTTESVGPHLLRITDIQDNNVNWQSVPFCEIDKNTKAKYTLKSGDLVFARTGATVGKSFLISGDIPDSVFASYLIRVRLPALASISFLSYFFKSPDYWQQITEFSSGIGQPNVNGSKLKELIVPVPSLAEQKQIAAKLDELLAQVDTIKTRLDTIPHILKRFRQSVLAAAVTGKLTEEWRNHATISESAKELKQRWLLERKMRSEKIHAKQALNLKIKQKKQFVFPCAPDLETRAFEAPREWEIVSIAEFADCLDSKRIPVKKDSRQTAQGLYPYFGANGEVDRVDQYIFEGDYVLVTEDETFYGRTKPIAYRFTGKCWVNNHAHILSAPTKDANDYLCFALMYFDVIPWLSGTTGRAKLTQAALNSLPIGLPSEAEQTEIVRRVEQLFVYADQIEQRANDAQSRVNHLTQSILAKAFRGELTADWRAQNPDLITGENSAEALLARIRAEREATATKPKTHQRKATT